MTTARKERKPGQCSRSVLRLIPERAVVFLQGVATHAGIAVVLAKGGYDATQHADGLRLLAEACALGDGHEEAARAEQKALAIAEIDRWSRANLTRFALAIAHVHPADVSLFDGVFELARERDHVAAAGLFIERILQLPADCDTRRTLAKRQLDIVELERVRALVETAQTHIESKSAERAEEHERRLLALRAWNEDWALTAKSLIRRRDWLVILGLAARERRRSVDLTREEKDG